VFRGAVSYLSVKHMSGLHPKEDSILTFLDVQWHGEYVYLPAPRYQRESTSIAGFSHGVWDPSCGPP
jgi:hypothetical protein